jgi:hypothetical protein
MLSMAVVIINNRKHNPFEPVFEFVFGKNFAKKQGDMMRRIGEGAAFQQRFRR